MEILLYLEVNIFSILLLLFMLINQKRFGTSMLDEQLFRGILRTVILILIVDSAARLFEGQSFTGASAWNAALAAVYFFLTGVICFAWLLYAEYKIYQETQRIHKRFKFYIIPLCILSVLSFASPWTGWLFYIGEGNIYHRGDLFLIQSVISYGYLLYSALIALLQSRKESLHAKRVEYYLISLFIALPILGSALQTVCYGLPLTWPSVVCSLLIVFINIQNQQISIDPLTGINNRGQLNKYLLSKVQNVPLDRRLYMILLDVDDFKSINDTYGHTKGDEALIATAGILKHVCGAVQGEYFLARYGGDEFAIICQCRSIEELKRMENAIREETNLMNQREKWPFQLSFSLGYAELDGNKTVNIEQLITAADQQMYLAKKERKALMI